MAVPLHQRVETQQGTMLCRGHSARVKDVLLAEINPNDATPELLCEKQRGRTLSRRNIQDEGGWTQREQRCQLFGEPQPTRVEAIAEQIPGCVTAIDVCATLLNACGIG